MRTYVLADECVYACAPLFGSRPLPLDSCRKRKAEEDLKLNEAKKLQEEWAKGYEVI